MAEKDEQLAQMRDAVDRKAAEAEAKSRATRHDQGELPADEDGPGSQAGRKESGHSPPSWRPLPWQVLHTSAPVSSRSGGASSARAFSGGTDSLMRGLCPYP